MKDTTLNIDLYCEKCGSPIHGDFTGDGGSVAIEPCESCLEDARKEGMEKAEENIL